MPIDYKDAVDRQLGHIVKNEGALWLSNRELTNSGVRYLSRQLSGMRGKDNAQSLGALHLNETHIDDEAIPSLVRIVKRAPNLKILNISGNKLTGAGIAELTEALKTHPRLELLNIGSNPLGPKGAEALAEYIAAPSCTMEEIQAHHSGFGDKGLASIAKAVGEKDHNWLTRINLMANDGGKSAAEEWTKTLLSDRRISSIHLTQEDEVFNEAVKDAYRQSENPNLTHVSPVNPGVAERTGFNRTACIKAANHLINKPETLAYDDLAFTLQRETGAQRSIVNGLPPYRYHTSRFHQHIDKMPRLPVPNASFADALFKPDASGFAPLDNPKIWRNADAVFKGLAASHTKPDNSFLTRTTPHGVTFLQSAAGMMASENLLSYLLKNHKKLGVEDLLDASRKPTPLYQAFIRRGDVGGIFMPENWLGKTPNALYAVYSALPEALQKDVPINTLRQTMRPSQQGRGR
ncbi:MAG: hypothetical protein FJX23_01205 [Alphaproteobacteria bacterium]|nr:hypothetical protein [Alphaproteobacteria bacterium]